jgi:hypothetical protein
MRFVARKSALTVRWSGQPGKRGVNSVSSDIKYHQVTAAIMPLLVPVNSAKHL